MYTKYIFLFLLLSGSLLVHSQNVIQNEVARGLSEFSLELLNKLSDFAGDRHNIVLSSYTVWTLLSILNSGAKQNSETSRQIMEVLRLPSDKRNFKNGFQEIQSQLRTKSSGVEIDIANVIFIDKQKSLKPDFRSQVASDFDIRVEPIDISNPIETIRAVDAMVESITRGKIKHFINANDLKNLQLLLTTAIYFKGDWNLPFNRSATFVTDFFDESLQRKLGQVNMMYQVGPFPYTKLANLRGHVIELPYGQDDKYSMLVILPMKNENLNNFINQLSKVPLQTIFDEIENAKVAYYGEDVNVYLPRFSISSDYALNRILKQMGLTKIFGSDAELDNISNDNLYLSRVLHQATIDVTEEGTVATGIAGGTISYKSPPGTFNATHPFLYLIVENSSKTVLFAGKYCNPNE